MKKFIIISILQCLYIFSAIAQDSCSEVQFKEATRSLTLIGNEIFTKRFFKKYKQYRSIHPLVFTGSYKICKDKLSFIRDAEVECELFSGSKQDFNTLMEYKSIEKKFINSVANCREQKYKTKSISDYFDINKSNPMDKYEDIMIKSCMVAVTPSIIFSPFDLSNKYVYCKKLSADLFDIVAPKCSAKSKASKENSNPCTALYDHVSNQVVNRPELDKVIEKFTNIFSKQSSKEIGENFLKVLDTIGDNNKRDALLVLSMFSSYITLPKIKERLYKSGQYLRLGNLSYIFDHQFEKITKSFLPIYYGNQMVRFNDKWITYSRKYHFFAALYIGCELKKRKHSDFMVKLATASIGLAYETKDFYGHYFLENDSFDLSYRNFEMDSGKYFDGGKLATQICE